MEINKNEPHEEKQALYPGLVIARRAVTVACVWQRLKRRQRMGELHRGEGEASRGALIGDCWPGETGGVLTRTGRPMPLGYRCVFGFLWFLLAFTKLKVR